MSTGLRGIHQDFNIGSLLFLMLIYDNKKKKLTIVGLKYCKVKIL